MKIAISATNANLEAQVDPRFGRCQYFLIVDAETNDFEAVPNTSKNAPSGAGIQAAQTVTNKGAKVVITGNAGPNAYQALSAAGVKIITGAQGTIRNVVEQYKNGQLTSTPTTTPFGAGIGSGMGMGMGRGMGMGGGRGGGRGRRFSTDPTYYSQQAASIPTSLQPQLSKEQQIVMLEQQIRLLQQQIEQIKKRLQELK